MIQPKRSFSSQSQRDSLSSPNSAPDQMARAWAVALLRRNSEELTEENITRMLSQRPTFASIVRKTPPTEPREPWSEKRQPRVAPTAAQAQHPAGAPENAEHSLRPSHILHDPETAMARAWAAAQLRRSGETITEENIQRLLRRKERMPASRATDKIPSSSLHSTRGDSVPRAVPDLAPEREVEIRRLERELADKTHEIKQLQESLSLHREREREDLHKYATLEAKLSEALNELRVQQEKVNQSVSEQEVTRRVREVEISWRDKFMTLERQEQEASRMRSEMEAKIEKQATLLGQQTAQNEKLAAALEKKESVIEALNTKSESLAIEAVELRSDLELLQRKFVQKSKSLEENQNELDELRKQLHEAKVQGGLLTSESRGEDLAEIERLRLLVSELSGFEHDPGIECRKVLVETLENELTMCLQREAALQARGRELEAGGDASSGTDPTAERKRLEISIAYLRKRIELLSTLIAESLAFLRRKEEGGFPSLHDEQPDNQ